VLALVHLDMKSLVFQSRHLVRALLQDALFL